MMPAASFVERYDAETIGLVYQNTRFNDLQTALIAQGPIPGATITGIASNNKQGLEHWVLVKILVDSGTVEVCTRLTRVFQLKLPYSAQDAKFSFHACSTGQHTTANLTHQVFAGFGPSDPEAFSTKLYAKLHAIPLRDYVAVDGSDQLALNTMLARVMRASFESCGMYLPAIDIVAEKCGT